jgi:hypothetical protein
MKLPGWIILYALLLAACQQTAPNTIAPAFYYWKQAWDTNSTEETALKNLPAKRLYVKLFDVTTSANGHILPVAVLKNKAPLPADMEIVPVVFLMNEIWAIRDSALPAKVAELVAQLCENIPAAQIREIQLDCDWTQSTKAAYFAFIQQVKKSHFFKDRKISATIRLYQLKYENKTGVPPVDKGLLMCYNMGNMRKPGEHISILELSTLNDYIGSKTVSNYSLPLDIALPLFEWQILFRQGLNYEGLVRDVKLSDSSIFTKTSEHLYTVKKDTILNGYRLKQHDIIRHEFVNANTLRKAARQIAQQLPSGNRAVVFYHLDSLILRNYPLNELQEIIGIFN